MKTRATFLLLSTVFAAAFLISGSCYAQEKPVENDKLTKTITIHITKEVDGNIVVIDTTVVTEGDFDADAFLEEKGVLNDQSEDSRHIEKNVIIRHPGSGEFSWEGSDNNLPDTIVFDEDRVVVFNDKFDMPFPPPPHRGMQLDYNFRMPDGFPLMEGPQFEGMMEDMARSFGLEDVMPFGEMKQVVVKKKRNGKKIIITFEDRDEKGSEHQTGNRKEEKVIIYKNGDQGMAPQNEERIISKGDQDEKIIINRDIDQTPAVKKQKKVIVITEEKTK